MAKKILLIEYEPRYLDRVRGYLAGRDFDLVVAKDGEEGLDAYRRGKPDLVLISSVLPKLRTPEVIKGMQEGGATPPILLMMTGYKGKNRKADAQRVGATGILEKPFTEEALVSEVEGAISGQGAPSSTATGSVPAIDPKAPLLSSDDIFSDVLSGMDDELPASSAPVTGTDPGIQRKLEETLSGILPAPRRSGGTGTVSKPAPAPAPAPVATAKTGPIPVVKAGPEQTMRVPTVEPAPVPRPPVKVDSSVDRMLTETLSGLRVKSEKAPKPAPAPVPANEAGQERTERIRLEPTPKPVPAPEPPAPKPEPRPAPKVEARPEPKPEPKPESRPAPEPPRAARPEPKPEPRPEPRRPATAVTAPAAVSGSFGRYSLLEKIAAGGMAEVFKARMRGEEGFEKIVAIKRILPHMADNDDFITMFIDEAKLAAQLTHNNIIHIYDLGKVDAYHYIAMEYVDGKDLRSILKLGMERGYPLPVELAVFVASKIANALDYAHRRMGMDGQELNLVHRDVSPQNILISFEGDIKLCDFGIAKAATKVSQTQTGALKGKLQYMSPEQAWGKKIDRRSDIFSLGIVLFEMLTGERLFTGDTDLTILEQVRDARVSAPSAKNPEVPKKVDQIVLKALGKNPQDRFQNASEMEKELNAVLYSFQPTPGPADLAIYMHRLMESQPVASDEQIDAAFARAAAEPTHEPAAKKGKGLVISKKAPAPAPVSAGPAPAPVADSASSSEAREISSVSAPALSLATEAGKSRTGLYAAIGVAVVGLVVAGVFLTKKKPEAAAPSQAAATPAATTTTVPGPATAAATTASEPASKVIDQKALDAEAKRIMAEKEKAARAAAVAPAPGKPAAQPPAAATVPSLAARGAIEPPKVAEQPTPVPPTPVPPKPTEVPKVAVAEAKPAPAPPPPAVESAPAPPPSDEITPGMLVGPGEGVVEPKLLSMPSMTLPPQAKTIATQRGAGGVIGTPNVLALVDENGNVTETRVLKASSYKFVDDAVVNALKKARFAPATKKGIKVKMWKFIAIPVKP